MARHLFWLSDGAWAAIEPHLPHGRPGKPRVDDRTVISGILHVLKTGRRWREVPAAYGPPTTTAITGGRRAESGSACSRRQPVPGPCLASCRSAPSRTAS
ncbi:transposase [Sphingomonas sp.]|uniref:transposase n=1 Tax=Sphingomonas sp. TaxID=28214 RepID=UPI003B00745A